MTKFKTQYKTLPEIEKRLDELTIQDCRRSLSKKENYEWAELLKKARQLRVTYRKPSLLEIRRKKINKILMGV